ncbi:MAG: hypothetical protein FWC19_01290 [Treponema sp.]|nr:hypothetical protein [Treponema sp.]MCL2271426.1 hypothetical protein [Treponema sp.]
MKEKVFIFLLFVFLLTPLSKAAAQSSVLEDGEIVFNTSGLPDWVKDVRRWDIIAFGTFPFSMFFTAFAVDIFRWGFESGFSFSMEGRRYAPWPFKSAGAVELTSGEFTRNIWIAVGLSAALAFADLLIVKLRQRDEKRRTDSSPPVSGGTYTIEKISPDVKTEEINYTDDASIIDENVLKISDLAASDLE